MISYIKLYGPPVYDAIKELEKIAIDMPEVCIMDTIIASPGTGMSLGSEGIHNYFIDIGVSMQDITYERCDTIISKSGEKLGEYDFFFEWFKEPGMNELNDLIQRIDKALTPLGTRYTITSK
jgi:thiamine biosynthesis protein ThiC